MRDLGSVQIVCRAWADHPSIEMAGPLPHAGKSLLQYPHDVVRTPNFTRHRRFSTSITSNPGCFAIKKSSGLGVFGRTYTQFLLPWEYVTAGRKLHPLKSARASALVTHGEEGKEEDDLHRDCDDRAGMNINARSVLCLSNGHGEDAIAASILTQLIAMAEENAEKVKIEVLPLVGEGHAYSRIGVSTVGPTKNMPSGGFIYMDILQLLGDMRAGLLSLILEQWGAIVQWVDENPDGVLLAVGDVFPLALAWLAAKRLRRKQQPTDRRSRGLYAFVGTAKSEFYIRADDGSRLRGNVESLLFRGGIYYPWERAMMADSQCRLVAPRDGLTAQVLKEHLPSSAQGKVQDLGNPMMDGLHPTGGLDSLLHGVTGRSIALLPGSRAPEVYINWRRLLDAAHEASISFLPQRLVFLAPVVPSLEHGPFIQAIFEADWHPYQLSPEDYKSVSVREPVFASEDKASMTTRPGEEVQMAHGHWDGSETWQGTNGLFKKSNALLLVRRGSFNDVVHWAEAGIAMAGTATEQLVGLGKPVFTLPGGGPQFTYAFAEAQSRLLGLSLFMCPDCKTLASRMWDIMSDDKCLMEIAANGRKRMGPAGAARRISEQFWTSILQ